MILTVVYKFPTSTGTQRALTISTVSRGQCFPARKTGMAGEVVATGWGGTEGGPGAGPLFFVPDSLAMFALALKTLGSIPFEIA